MEQAKVLALMEKEAKSNWSSKYPLALDDRPFKVTEQNSIFLRHSVVFGDGVRTGIGTEFYRYQGIQYLSIFYQAGSGNQSIYAYADEIVRHYTDKILTDEVTINFSTASTIKLPRDVAGFNQLQIVCPFYFDTTRS